MRASGKMDSCNIRAALRILHSSIQQVSGEVETRFGVLRLKIVTNHNVTGFSLEFERVDDRQCTKRQNCELEYENGGKRDWREEATVDGNGPVVETLA